MRIRFILSIIFALACGPAFAQDTGAPILNEDSPNVVPGRYIVVFKGDVGDTEAAIETFRSQVGVEVFETYDVDGFDGFAASLSDEAIAVVRSDPSVAYIVPDTEVTLEATQNNPPWGLDRIDQDDLPLDMKYNYSKDGTGVSAYVIDTGIRASHTDFGGRVKAGYNATSESGGTNDCHGHGTHVAGTIGGATYGAAKNVNLYPVRVFGCSGSTTTSIVIKGVNWVTANAAKPAVTNMSLGGPANQALDDAVRNSIRHGVVYAVSAGNNAADACNKSPARVEQAITVGAMGSGDVVAYFSDHGSCVDLYAPGVGITSAGHASDSASATMNGTSMASPHAAGVAALIGTIDAPATMVKCATRNRLRGVPAGTPNLLLNSLRLTPCN